MLSLVHSAVTLCVSCTISEMLIFVLLWVSKSSDVLKGCTVHNNQAWPTKYPPQLILPLTICFLPLPTLLPSLHPFSLYHTIFLHPFPWGYWRRQVWRPPPPSRWIQEPSVVKTGMEDTQEDPLAVHCFCVCSGSALLGDLLGVSRCREHHLPWGCEAGVMCDLM